MQSARRIAGACLALALAVGGTSAGADVKAGVDAWSAGDYGAAVREWKGPADAGDADAMFNLAQAHKLGRGTTQDLRKAEELYAKAAAKGHLQAADNYGLLLFDRGERARAMPYVSAAAQRGDPRAQYLLGLSYFNADNVPKDWVRAYALVSLAQRAGLPQAAPALAQMDRHIPLDQRQKSMALASELAAAADATRERQLAAADLGVTPPGSRQGQDRVAMGPPSRKGAAVSPEAQAAVAASAAREAARRAEGKDYPQARVPAVSGILDPQAPSQTAARPAQRPATKPPSTPGVQTSGTKPVPTPAPAPASRPAPASGAWRIQLGAFGVPGNADALWNRVKARPELAGHARIDAPAGRLVKLQAGGFASAADAQSACARLKAAGFTCIAVSR